MCACMILFKEDGVCMCVCMCVCACMILFKEDGVCMCV